MKIESKHTYHFTAADMGRAIMLLLADRGMPMPPDSSGLTIEWKKLPKGEANGTAAIVSFTEESEPGELKVNTMDHVRRALGEKT